MNQKDIDKNSNIDQQSGMEQTWQYETKCRRCGKLTVWNHSQRSSVNRERFLEHMMVKLQHPMISPCGKCKRQTIQDLTTHDL